ncbi:hypothetical protein J2Z66_003078 [Paenibacillus eucommiae]|uniref:Uncharacterized protein n=1 Tax=Paenibacillus eucommiae TaxID=1355755 RepID=A0ABS4IWU8_9BACL|nr:hypothetical protein [Paenibacillus eucommiae]
MFKLTYVAEEERKNNWQQQTTAVGGDHLAARLSGFI